MSYRDDEEDSLFLPEEEDSLEDQMTTLAEAMELMWTAFETFDAVFSKSLEASRSTELMMASCIKSLALEQVKHKEEIAKLNMRKEYWQNTIDTLQARVDKLESKNTKE